MFGFVGFMLEWYGGLSGAALVYVKSRLALLWDRECLRVFICHRGL